MKTILYLVGLLAVFVLVAFLESPDIREDQKTNYYTINGDSESVNASIQEPIIPQYTQYILDETIEDNDEIIEVYREYNVFEDENGVVIKRVPTNNYDSLRYSKKDE